ncbi:metal-sensitive transcriptional regulator [Nocardioides aurantiacus]|uniref:DNA-binding FrmR family transcriptional regulator n=1 Tax=Nocardioides aurantiacus TaxID=86796 RepID=A0A3N2CYL9_9ACTN|nr:metal-sensitive transcriptional regulator [Nocardioides aurantiacus]ROR92576.1 DNA-binding FrmR family transcriptional regulator [Nocardioides aurantiacus]
MDTTPGYHDHKGDYLTRLRRIEGQVRGLQRMVDEDVYCIDILTQVSAVKSALASVSVGLVQDHLGHCVQDAVAGAAAGDEDGRARAEAKVAEASAAITRLLKS